MANMISHHENRTQPAEYINTTPIYCSTCGTEYDLEMDEGDRVDLCGGQYYCTESAVGGSCYQLARIARYRSEVSDDILGLLGKAMEEIKEYDYIYSDVEDDSEDHPFAVIEDAIERVKAYSEGKPPIAHDELAAISRNAVTGAFMMANALREILADFNVVLPHDMRAKANRALQQAAS